MARYLSIRKIRYLVLGLVATIVGGVVGGVSYAAVLSVVEERPAPQFEVNTNGQTFGSGLDARTPEEEPDLMEAIGNNGRVGYVLSADIRSPNLTLEQVRAQLADAVPDRVVPLYAADGVTVIDTFTVQGTSGAAGLPASR